MSRWYEVLGVSENADPKTVKRAFRELAFLSHPDTGGDNNTFLKIQKAYNFFAENVMLQSAEKDAKKSDTRSYALAERFLVEDGWIFDGPRGEDVVVKVSVDQKTSVFGGTVYVPRTRLEPCPECRGAGHSFESRCLRCSGECFVSHYVYIKVDVPSRTKTGDSLKLYGLGDVGVRGVTKGYEKAFCGPCGALIVRFEVQTGTGFVLKGSDLYTSLSVSYIDAILGASVELRTLDGTCEVVIGPGTQPGQRVRIRGKGAPKGSGDDRGDLLVEILVKIPDHTSSAERALLNELRGIQPRF